MEVLYCKNCKKETIHHEVDMGNGYTERGSHGMTHVFLVAECSVCGAIQDDWDGGEVPI